MDKDVATRYTVAALDAALEFLRMAHRTLWTTEDEDLIDDMLALSDVMESLYKKIRELDE